MFSPIALLKPLQIDYKKKFNFSNTMKTRLKRDVVCVCVALLEVSSAKREFPTLRSLGSRRVSEKCAMHLKANSCIGGVAIYHIYAFD